MECIFCKIIKKEIPSEFLYEDEYSISILDVNPRAPGHTMVLPKMHAESILKLPAEQVCHVFSAVRRMTEVLDKAFAPDGFTIGINQGRAAGQAVDHLHIHIIPRWHADRGGSVHSVVTNIPRESLDEIRSKIMKQL